MRVRHVGHSEKHPILVIKFFRFLIGYIDPWGAYKPEYLSTGLAFVAVSVVVEFAYLQQTRGKLVWISS